MLLFISVIITCIILRKCGIWNKEIGDSSVRVRHVVMGCIYIMVFCGSPILAVFLFLILEGKGLFNKLKKEVKPDVNHSGNQG